MIAMIAGICFLWIRTYLQVIGVMVIMVSLFSLLMLPDCKLYEIHQDYIVLYNRHDKSECFIIYYEDMVSWHYEWNPSYDQLVISLVDGSVEKQEVYAKYRIEKWLNSLAPGKQAKKNYRKQGMMKLVNPEAVEKCKANMICEADVDNMSLIFDMFSDSTRLKIMNALFVSELCVGDLAALLQMSTSAISHQLSSLKKTKLVKTKKIGKNVYYSMADEHIEKIYQMTYEHIKEDD